MKILQISAQYKLRSGGALQMARLSAELSKMGHNVTAVYNINDKFAVDFEKFKWEKTKLKFMDLPKFTLKTHPVKCLLKLRKFLKKEKFDIIHAHKGRAASLISFASIGFNVNLVSNRGVINELDFWNSLKYKSKKLKRVITVSQAVKDVMVKTGNLNPDKINVVFGSVDTEEYKPGLESSLRDEFKISEDTRVVGFVGNSGPRKGLKYLIEAFEIVNKRIPKTVLVLAGVDSAGLKDYTIADYLKEKIISAGFRHDGPNVFNGFDVFAFSGIAEEGLTGTVREAAACGLPIVTTDVAGNRELIYDKENGLVVPMRDSDSLAEAILYLLGNKEKAIEFGQKARSFVEKNMSNEVRASKIESIYKEILHS